MITRDAKRPDTEVLDITSDVKWIGILDYDIVTFDVVMTTEYGTTYNSYFINSAKKTIIETSKEPFWDVYLEKIKKVTNPAEIEYIVLNHTEPDHSGNLGRLLEIAPNATVVASRIGVEYLKDQLGKPFRHLIAKDGDTLNLGNKTLRFISAPNLHWPDSMYTYLEEEKLLFTCDSFGCHYAHHKMYDDQVGNFDDAFKYYFDVILKPFSKFMLKAIEKIRPLEINAILTGHGPLLLKDWKRWVDLSESYARETLATPQKNYVFIPFVSAYKNTGKMAEAIAEGIRSTGDFSVEVSDIEHMPLGDIDERIARCHGLVIGCPTINQNILLPIYKMFAVMSPIRDKGKVAGSFGSYGWSGEAAKLINSMLTNLKLQVVDEGVFFKFSPHQDQFRQGVEYGKAIGEKINSLS
ncbi:MAG TPA: FprA family A-type flavoprotein [Bacteroidales bacterium]|nr:FprA family A-type flavoprotein [Bacteroidales bacterium]